MVAQRACNTRSKARRSYLCNDSLAKILAAETLTGRTATGRRINLDALNVDPVDLVPKQIYIFSLLNSL